MLQSRTKVDPKWLQGRANAAWRGAAVRMRVQSMLNPKNWRDRPQQLFGLSLRGNALIGRARSASATAPVAVQRAALTLNARMDVNGMDFTLENPGATDDVRVPGEQPQVAVGQMGKARRLRFSRLPPTSGTATKALDNGTLLSADMHVNRTLAHATGWHKVRWHPHPCGLAAGLPGDEMHCAAVDLKRRSRLTVCTLDRAFPREMGVRPLLQMPLLMQAQWANKRPSWLHWRLGATHAGHARTDDEDNSITAHASALEGKLVASHSLSSRPRRTELPTEAPIMPSSSVSDTLRNRPRPPSATAVDTSKVHAPAFRSRPVQAPAQCSPPNGARQACAKRSACHAGRVEQRRCKRRTARHRHNASAAPASGGTH